MAHLLLSSYRRALLVMAKDLGTSTPRRSHSSLKLLLSFSSAVSATSTVHDLVPSLLHHTAAVYWDGRNQIGSILDSVPASFVELNMAPRWGIGSTTIMPASCALHKFLNQS